MLQKYKINFSYRHIRSPTPRYNKTETNIEQSIHPSYSNNVSTYECIIRGLGAKWNLSIIFQFRMSSESSNAIRRIGKSIWRKHKHRRRIEIVNFYRGTRGNNRRKLENIGVKIRELSTRNIQFTASNIDNYFHIYLFISSLTIQFSKESWKVQFLYIYLSFPRWNWWCPSPIHRLSDKIRLRIGYPTCRQKGCKVFQRKDSNGLEKACNLHLQWHLRTCT